MNETQALPGDANLDGRVDATDLNRVGLNWRGTGKTWTQGDFTGDGNVDAADLNVLALNWRRGVAAPAVADGLPARRVPRAPLAHGYGVAIDAVMAVADDIAQESDLKLLPASLTTAEDAASEIVNAVSVNDTSFVRRHRHRLVQGPANWQVATDDAREPHAEFASLVDSLLANS
jgi:hypothetical protein